MSQFEEIPSPGRGFQGSRALGGLAACKTLASLCKNIAASYCSSSHSFQGSPAALHCSFAAVSMAAETYDDDELASAKRCQPLEKTTQGGGQLHAIDAWRAQRR